MHVTSEVRAENLNTDVIYSLELQGDPSGLYKATVQAGFVVGELPQLDGHYYRPEDELAISLKGVFQAATSCDRDSTRTEVPLLQEGVQAVPVRGRFLTVQTGQAALKYEVDKFCFLPHRGRGLKTRHAMFYGLQTAERFVEALPVVRDPRPRALQRAFSVTRPHVGEISPFRFW